MSRHLSKAAHEKSWLSLQAELNRSFSFSAMFLPLPLAGMNRMNDVSWDEQNEWCTETGQTMGLIHGLGKQRIVTELTLALLFAEDTAMLSWKHRV